MTAWDRPGSLEEQQQLLPHRGYNSCMVGAVAHSGCTAAPTDPMFDIMVLKVSWFACGRAVGHYRQVVLLGILLYPSLATAALLVVIYITLLL